MRERLSLFSSYLEYRIKARGRHGIHSPFVFDLFVKVIQDTRHYPFFSRIGQCRNRLIHNHHLIPFTDYGAGSLIVSGKSRRISVIARTASKSRKYGELLFRLVRYFNPDRILELGTSLGISASYLAAARPEARLVSLEGCPGAVAIARDNFIQLQIDNIIVITGRFEDKLPEALGIFSGLDLVFFDGNHRMAPTMEYFLACLQLAHPGTLFIFDDIHWSREMESAWNLIRQHPRVTMTIDLFYLGLVFFREEFRDRQHFILRY